MSVASDERGSGPHPGGTRRVREPRTRATPGGARGLDAWFAERARTVGLLTGKGQLATEGALRLFMKWSRHALDVLVDVGRDWEEEFGRPRGNAASRWTMTPTEAGGADACRLSAMRCGLRAHRQIWTSPPLRGGRDEDLLRHPGRLWRVLVVFSRYFILPSSRPAPPEPGAVRMRLAHRGARRRVGQARSDAGDALRPAPAGVLLRAAQAARPGPAVLLRRRFGRS